MGFAEKQTKAALGACKGPKMDKKGLKILCYDNNINNEVFSSKPFSNQECSLSKV